MSSWRDTASQSAQDDLDGLLNAALPFAQQQLAKHGEFYPYGVAVANDGTIAMLAAEVGGDRPSSAKVLDLLVDGAKGNAGQYRAVAFVADVKMQDRSDAIQVQMEHRDGPCLAVLMPYKKGRFGGGMKYGDLAGATAPRRVWGSST